MGKISIIIPAYNAENSIQESLRSLMNQTHTNFEVVIIDDGSTDNTSNKVIQYISNDKRFKYFHQENSGVAMARNKGIGLSNGEYISFLDADDFYETTYLEKMYDQISITNSDVCYCGYNISNNDFQNNKETKFKSGDILLDYIFGKVSIHTTGWLIRKKLLNENDIIFPPGVSWGEDFEFFSEVVASTNKVCYVDEYLTNYKVDHNESQLSVFSLDKIDKDFESIMRIVENAKVNKDSVIERALLDYRLQALIIYRLVTAIEKGMDSDEIKKYYDKYGEYLKKCTFNNGLRSLKLNISRARLIKIMKNY